MHYRWSFDNSAELLSSWLSEHSPETDVSLAEKKATWRARQKGIFVDGDGVTEETRAAVESRYHHALSSLETLFEKRDFMLGDRPTQADFGFMGPMFRHFFCDPDPARLMRDTAPGVQEWVARMWNMTPQRFSSVPQIEAIPDDLSALLEPAVSVYLPYLQANEAAVLAGQEQLGYEAMGTRWLEPAKPYRLWCLDRLRKKLQALDASAREGVSATLGDVAAMDILTTVPTGRCEHLLANLPYSPTGERPAFDSWGREAVLVQRPNRIHPSGHVSDLRSNLN